MPMSAAPAPAGQDQVRLNGLALSVFSTTRGGESGQAGADSSQDFLTAGFSFLFAIKTKPQN